MTDSNNDAPLHVEALYGSYTPGQMFAWARDFATGSTATSDAGCEALAEGMLRYTLLLPETLSGLLAAWPHSSNASQGRCESKNLSVMEKSSNKTGRGIPDIKIYCTKCSATAYVIEVKIDASLTDEQTKDEYWEGKINLLVVPSYRLGHCREQVKKNEKIKKKVDTWSWLDFGAKIVKHIPSELGLHNFTNDLVTALVSYAETATAPMAPVLGDCSSLNKSDVANGLSQIPHQASRVASAFDSVKHKLSWKIRKSGQRPLLEVRSRLNLDPGQWTVEIDPGYTDGKDTPWPFWLGHRYTHADDSWAWYRVPYLDREKKVHLHAGSLLSTLNRLDETIAAIGNMGHSLDDASKGFSDAKQGLLGLVETSFERKQGDKRDGSLLVEALKKANREQWTDGLWPVLESKSRSNDSTYEGLDAQAAALATAASSLLDQAKGALNGNTDPNSGSSSEQDSPSLNDLVLDLTNLKCCLDEDLVNVMALARISTVCDEEHLALTAKDSKQPERIKGYEAAGALIKELCSAFLRTVAPSCTSISAESSLQGNNGEFWIEYTAHGRNPNDDADLVAFRITTKTENSDDSVVISVASGKKKEDQEKKKEDQDWKPLSTGTGSARDLVRHLVRETTNLVRDARAGNS